MEAAAKSVQQLSQRILNDTPHHLSFYPEWRYRAQPDETKLHHEEWRTPRLQYMTFISEADRGILFTRPHYDMREELPSAKPLPRDVSALASSSSTPGGGDKKKLSLSDYRNKKTSAASSASPPEPSIAKKKESERIPSALANDVKKPPITKPDTQKRTETPQPSQPKPPRNRDSQSDMRYVPPILVPSLRLYPPSARD